MRGPTTGGRQPVRLTPPTQAEIDAIPADRRLELMDLDKQRIHRRVNTLVLIGGVLATVGTLLVSAQTLRTAEQGQVTDRYTKATEQLGSDKREVRTAAIYALGRIAEDSSRDHRTIRDVLAAFIRERDPAPTIKKQELPSEPDTDVAAALTVLTSRPPDYDYSHRLDLRGARLPGATLPLPPHPFGANLTHANLSDADLSSTLLVGADLSSTILVGTNLTGANLTGTNLSGAFLVGADLSGATLVGADLTRANLTGVNLTSTDLRRGKVIPKNQGPLWPPVKLHGATLAGADLRKVDLTDVDLAKADLVGADLSGANLQGADLRGADLREAKGVSRKAAEDSGARTDGGTRW